MKMKEVAELIRALRKEDLSELCDSCINRDVAPEIFSGIPTPSYTAMKEDRDYFKKAFEDCADSLYKTKAEIAALQRLNDTKKRS